jgi:hypothetical protein
MIPGLERVLTSARTRSESQGDVGRGRTSHPYETRMDHLQRGCANGLTKRLDDPVVVLFARSPVSRCCESGGGRLQSGVVSDVHPPVGADLLGRAVREVTLDDREEIADLLGARLVFEQPPVPLPVGQAHVRSR